MLKVRLSHRINLDPRYGGTECSSTTFDCKTNRKVNRNYATANNHRRLLQYDTQRTVQLGRPRNFWKEQSNQRKFFDDLGKKIGINSLDDWYEKLSRSVCTQNGGGGVMAAFNNSPSNALMAAYPEHNWIPWKFSIVHRGYWSEISNQRKFFDDLGQILGVQNVDDWYEKLSWEKVSEHGGASLLSKYKGSPVSGLMAVYPEHNWIPWKFQNVPRSFWKDSSNRRKFFDALGKKIGIQTLDDWYHKLSKKVCTDYGGSGFLATHKNSAILCLMSAYPEHNWIPWKFNQVHQGYWKDVANQRKFFDALGIQLGVENLDDWYQTLKYDVITENGGAGLLAKYKGSPIHALMASYPEHNWIPWKFQNVPRSFWKDPANVRNFFDAIGKQIGIHTLDDWYSKLSSDVVEEKGGSGLLVTYQTSPLKALMAAYPEHNWVPWKFNNVTRGFWNSSDNIKAFISELSEKLSIQTLDDWYRVDWIQLQKFGASQLLFRQKGLYNILKEQYPHHPWNEKRLQQVGKKGQRWLAVTLKKMFPDEEVIEDFMHPKASFKTSKRPMQLDVFIPSKNLAFEYQGKQHYEEVGVFSPTRQYQLRDEEKRNLCAANDIKLVEVPYWWNRTQESLQDIINQSGK